MIELIINKNSSASHLTLIEKILQDANEVNISVAFLKTSGIKQLVPFFKKKIVFKIIAGANFGITEPEALKLLLEQGNNVTGYLNNLKSKINFHPKMYLVRSGHVGHIIIGSANLTNGGMSTNHECSLYYRCDIADRIWLDAVNHFNKSIHPENADLLTDRIIAMYTPFYKRQKNINKEIEQFPDVADNLFYDLDSLKKHYNALDKASLRQEYDDKTKHYKRALKILDKIANTSHSPEDFKILIEELVGKAGQPGYWYSNGMFRHKTDIFKQQPAFRQLINSIKTNINKNPAEIYKEAKRISDNIYGVGPNFIGEIMMTYAPKKLANINRNPITVLREEAKADIKSHSQQFTGTDYQVYNNIVKEIAFKLGLDNMLQADSFFNRIYQELKDNIHNNSSIK